MKILGIDPGQQTGIAIFEDGNLTRLETIEPVDLSDYIKTERPEYLVFEDSRLTSPVFCRGVKRLAMLKIARNVGQIDAWCSLIVAICDREKIPAKGISPKGKGMKLDAPAFQYLTGWTGKSNQHTRDAAMVAWPYRNYKFSVEKA